MRKRLAGAAFAIAAAASIPFTALAATGTPQRDSSRVPPGLEKNLARAVPGIMRALIATEGSNSRLQELPVSP